MALHVSAPGPLPMDDPSLITARVEELAEEFLDRRRHGDRPTVAEYTEKYPELADQIRAFFPALALVEELKPGPGDLTGSFNGSSFPAQGTTLTRLGDYRILREVGRGGMGVVYEAEQESLGRRVALKVLASASLLDPRQLARFHREAKAAARLHHTNIVPVFGVGEAEGIHYYVMQFIPGRGLDEVIDEMKRQRKLQPKSNTSARWGLGSLSRRLTPSGEAAGAQSPLTSGSEPEAGSDDRLASGTGVSAEESIATASPPPSGNSVLSSGADPAKRFAWGVARIGVQVAEALSYAHAQGTLHRDIKPSNILLDAHGNSWVADFGLAKADADNDLTHTGDIVGTIRYMAPERFHGLCDARSDIYSLGLTLYELLARRPAFDESSRNTLIRQVTQSEPPRLRRLDPSISKDIETIVHKAIEKDPNHRYESAGALAADLRRFLEDRPIEARRVSAVERLTRWRRRNPGLAWSIALVFVLLAGSALLSSALYLRMRQKAADAEAANEHLQAAQDQLQRTLYASHMNLAQAAWDSSDIGRVQRILNEERPTSDGPDLRGWEWHYWQRLCHNELLTLRGHHDRVIAVAYSPDGRNVLSAGDDGTVRFWDAGTGAQLRVLELGARMPRDAAFSPDGRQIAVAGTDHRGPGRLEVRDTSNGAPLWSVRDTAGPLHGLAYSADGRTLAIGAANGSVVLYDTDSGTELRQLALGREPVAALAFSPDGQSLAVSHFDGSITICDVPSGRERARATGHTGPVNGIAFHPSGTTFATCGADRSVRLWDAATGTLLRIQARHAGPVRRVSFSADGRLLASVGADQTIRITDPSDGRELAALHGHADLVHDMAFSPDSSRLASCGFDETIKVWDPHARPAGAPVFTARTPGMIDALALSPDGQRIALSVGIPQKRTCVEVWNAVDGTLINVLEGHRDLVSAVVFTADSKRLLTASRDRTVRLCDVATGKEQRLWSDRDPVRTLALSPDGEHVALAIDRPRDHRSLRILDLKSGAITPFGSLERTEASTLAFSSDGRQLASAGGNGTIRIWNALSQSLITTCKGHEGPVESLAFSPDGKRLASGSMDRQLRIWDASTGRILFTYEGHSSGVTRVAFTPDGKRVASAGRTAVKLWDTFGGGELLGLKDQNHLAISADGWRIVTAGENRNVYVWDASPRGPEDPEEQAYLEQRRFSHGRGRPPFDRPPPPSPRMGSFDGHAGPPPD